MNEKELRELDAWIAVHVIGWNRLDVKTDPTDNRTIDGVLYSPPGCRYDCGQSSCVPCYSANPAAAMQVLEKCARGRTITIEHGATAQNKMQWMVACLNDGKEDNCKCADTLPLAICLAAKQIFHREP